MGKSVDGRRRPRGRVLAGVGLTAVTGLLAVTTNIATSEPLPSWLSWLKGNQLAAKVMVGLFVVSLILTFVDARRGSTDDVSSAGPDGSQHIGTVSGGEVYGGSSTQTGSIFYGQTIYVAPESTYPTKPPSASGSPDWSASTVAPGASAADPPSASHDYRQASGDPSQPGRQWPRVISSPPAVIPDKVRDRHATVQWLRRRLRELVPASLGLTGPPGAGKTAIVRQLFLDLGKESDGQRFDVLAYTSVRSHELITGAFLVDLLIKALPHEGDRDVIKEEVLARDVAWIDKIDRVLRAVRGTRVLFVLDNVEDLLDTNGAMTDRTLRMLLEDLAQRGDHSVSLVLVCSRELPIALLTKGRDTSRDVDAGLPRGWDKEFLADLLATAPSAARALARLDSPRLQALTAGNPRRLELLVSAASLDTGLARDDWRPLAPSGVDGADALLDYVLDRLTSAEIAVVRALAALGSPVPARAVHEVVRDGTRFRDVVRVLEHLAEIRLVRIQGDHWYLPPPPAAEDVLHYAPASTSGATGRQAASATSLVTRAADYFHRQQIGEPPDVEALFPYLREIDLRIKAGQYEPSVKRMAAIDEPYLERWGLSDVLLPWRDRIAGNLDSYQHEVHNFSRMAEAWSQMGRHEKALEALRRAEQIARDEGLDRDLETLRLQLANMSLRDDHLTAARPLYAEILAEPAKRLPSLLATARLGLLLCDLEEGEYEAAAEQWRTAEKWAWEEDSDASRNMRARLLHARGRLHQYKDEVSAALDRYVEAEQLATLLGQHVFAARSLDAQAIVQLDNGSVTGAIESARRAVRVGAEGHHADLSRQANGTLALAYLRAGDLDRALQASTNAVRYSRSRRSYAVLIIKGITEFRRDPIDPQGVAKNAFLQAHRQAKLLVDDAPRSYQVLDSLGLICTGLFLCNEHGADKEAIKWYRRARAGTPDAPGVLRRTRNLLDDLTRDVDQAWTAEIKAVATTDAVNH